MIKFQFIERLLRYELKMENGKLKMNVSAKRTDLNYFSQKNTLIFNFQFSILNYERSSINRNLKR